MDHHFTIRFDTTVDDGRLEDVELIETVDGVHHVATQRTDGPRFFLHEGGRLDLQSAKVDRIIVEGWGENWERVDATSVDTGDLFN